MNLTDKQESGRLLKEEEVHTWDSTKNLCEVCWDEGLDVPSFKQNLCKSCYEYMEQRYQESLSDDCGSTWQEQSFELQRLK